MWDTLTSMPPANDVLNLFAIISLVVHGLAFLFSGLYASRPGSPPLGQRYSRRFVSRSATLLGWASGIGLFFLIIRLLQINPLTFGTPIWIVFAWVLLIAVLIDAAIRSRNAAVRLP